MDRRQELEEFEDRLAYKIASENRRMQNEQWGALFKPTKADVALSNILLRWAAVLVLLVAAILYGALHMH